MANSGLGRGLGSLIPNKKSSSNNSDNNIVSPQASGQILQIAVDKIGNNSMQPRQSFDEVHLDELAESIKEHGIIQPLVVCSLGEGQYELIAGERRLRASKKAGLETVPAIVRDSDQQEKLELALIENIQREDLNSIDLAHAYQRLIDEFNLSQDQVAKRVGKSRPVITNTLRMINLPNEIQAGIIEGRITEGHAKYIMGLEGEEQQLMMFRRIVQNKMTIPETSEEIRKMGGTKKARIKINYEDKDKEFAFREFFGARVEIKRKGKGGEVIIHYHDDEELGEIVNKVRK